MYAAGTAMLIIRIGVETQKVSWENRMVSADDT